MAKLYFYYSAMNAGKSTTLLQSDYNYRERGMETLLFTPEFDHRHKKGLISSRIGLKANAIPFDAHTDLYSAVAAIQQERPTLRCVFVDEAQFLNKQQAHQLAAVVDQLNLPVLTYGLRSDFKGEPFEGSLYLLILAEEVAEIKTICHCGRKATMNMRIDAKGNKVSDGAQVEIGGNDRYIATCRIHFNCGDSGQKK